jgi:AraC family transcriptional regulator, L-rhamnose operon transcriptional activator RhaR
MNSGSATFESGKSLETLSAGTIVSIPPGAACRLFDGPGLEWILIQFDPAALGIGKWSISQVASFAAIFPALASRPQAARHRVCSMRLVPKHYDGALALVGEIEREISQRLPGWKELSLGHFQHLVILLSRHAGEVMDISADATLRVAESIRRIESRYMEQIDLGELARSCAMSERNFFRLFRQATGQPPRAYMERLRIEHASERLRNTDMTITEIAFACGFVDSNFFARQFRKITGHSPSEYRRRWQT